MLNGLAALLLAAQLSAPRALITYPAADHNGAFSYTLQEDFVNQLLSFYRVSSVSDIENEDELYKVPLHNVKLLVLSGHGMKTSLALGGPADPCLENCDEKKYLDLSDEDELRVFFSKLPLDATILLQSCSTAEGGDDNNLANMVKRAAGQRRVIAPMLPISPDGIVIKSSSPFDADLYRILRYHYGVISVVECTYRR